MTSVDGDDVIRIERHDPEWADRFAVEATAIQAAIGPWITGGIHHVGSTAVPGLAAKPIIDIQVGVEDLAASRPCIELLAPLDYCYAPYRADEMHWFCKPGPRNRTHHVHLVPTDSPRFAEVLALRDYLRAHPDAAVDYEKLKARLAIHFRYNREAYTEGKREFVLKLTRIARRWVDQG